jgi:hypothetical protein
VATRQILIAASVGLLTLLSVVRLSRQGKLSFRYTMGWIAVASIGVLAGLFVPAAEPIAQSLGMSAAALLGLSALMFVTVIAIQLSISISGLQRQVRSLAEDLARLRGDRSETSDGM